MCSSPVTTAAALPKSLLQRSFARNSVLRRMDGVLQTGDSKTWREVAHSLKGAARGIGAFAMADAAAACEPIDPASDNTGAAGALRVLKTDSEAVKIFIDAYLNL